MVKSELIKAVAAKASTSIKDADEVVNAVFDVIGDTLHDGDVVNIVGFGKFGVTHRAGRIGRNPQTKTEIQIAATNTPNFKAGKPLKDLVN